MKNLRILPVLMILALGYGAVMTSSSSALEMQDTMAVQGTVVSIEDNVLTINEGADLLAEEEQVEFQITADTIFQDIESVNELLEGEQIIVQYEEVDGEKIALQVTRVPSQASAVILENEV